MLQRVIKNYYKNDPVDLDGIHGNVVINVLADNRYKVQMKVTHDPQGKPHAAGTEPTTDVIKDATEMGLDYSAWPDANPCKAYPDIIGLGPPVPWHLQLLNMLDRPTFPAAVAIFDPAGQKQKNAVQKYLANAHSAFQADPTDTPKVLIKKIKAHANDNSDFCEDPLVLFNLERDAPSLSTAELKMRLRTLVEQVLDFSHTVDDDDDDEDATVVENVKVVLFTNDAELVLLLGLSADRAVQYIIGQEDKKLHFDHGGADDKGKQDAMRVMKHRIYEQRAKNGDKVEVSLLKECFLAPGGVAPSKPVSIGKMLTTLTTKGSHMGISFYEQYRIKKKSKSTGVKQWQNKKFVTWQQANVPELTAKPHGTKTFVFKGCKVPP